MTPTWESRPVVAPVVQVRIAAMHAAVAERHSAVACGAVLPEDGSEWTRARAASWEHWLWTESDISRAARKVGASS